MPTKKKSGQLALSFSKRKKAPAKKKAATKSATGKSIAAIQKELDKLKAREAKERRELKKLRPKEKKERAKLNKIRRNSRPVARRKKRKLL